VGRININKIGNMKKFLYIVLLIGLWSCNKRNNEFGKLSYQTSDSTNLPMVIQVNGTFVDSVTEVGSWDCYHADEFILLKPEVWEITIFTPTTRIDTLILIKLEHCNMIEI